jgi:GNAT superfamily N-acetyltransferase
VIEIRALQEGDDRSQLHSGDPDLGRFFHKFAGQNQFKHHLGVTYVAIDGERIGGFATVAPGHVEIEKLPASARKKLPRYPLPVLRLARLAVDQAMHGQGLGRQLLGFVLQLALRMARDFGCVGVVVDARPDAVDFYQQYGFVSVDVVEGQSDARPAPIPMFLAIRAIRTAFGAQDE